MTMTPKVIVLTGASGGIGAAAARRLGAHGHRLVLAARREAELRAVAREAGAEALPVVTDVCVRADVERLRDAALERFGHVDVWINNAGRGITRPVLELTDDDVDAMMAVNLKSALYGMQAIVPHFQSRGAGHLINVSSMLGRVPFVPVRSAYNAAKHGLNALTANLRMDLRRTHPGIHVTLLMPGVVTTDFSQNALHGTSAPPGAGGPPGQTADEVAAVLESVIDAPRPDVYTSPALAERARKYYEDVAAFEDGLAAAARPHR
jgi:NADP-dependent 3-hydroxy acid dehydrogenase YdfG